MSISKSVVVQLLKHFPSWRPQMYFKSSLTALSHAMEDRVLASSDSPLIIASFQKERFYRQEAHRYRRIAQKTDQVYVLAAPEAEFKHSSHVYETVAFEPTDSLAQEWHLVVIGEDYASCLICHEKTNFLNDKQTSSAMDNSRRFEGIWTFERQISLKAADLLLQRILKYRPELNQKIERGRKIYLATNPIESSPKLSPRELKKLENNNPDPFVQRLVSYLQAGHYKLLKANKSLAIKQQKEQLLNSVTDAIRRSLDTEEILQVAVQKLGEGLNVCRCLVYRCSEKDSAAIINHEFISSGIKSVKGQTWQLKNNPLFEEVVELRDSLRIDDTRLDPRINQQAWQQGTGEYLINLVQTCSISSWLLVPVLYQDRLLGMMELHHCDEVPIVWKEDDVALVDAIATQVGVALIQAESYANLEDLNEQLEALDRTRSNLVAITGHELRTPLSTIQVCLESLASEPDMSPELRQVMLNTALADAERMRNLIQDFLTLSRLESGRVEWNSEALSINECIELAISNVRSRLSQKKLPQIVNLTPAELPLVQADGEWLVEVLAKLLDNACKFTNSEGQITIAAKPKVGNKLEVTITDTGRGIEPNRLETVFERFYQEEGALRRSAGGTGLGLAICRQIVKNWGGKIWAESEGRDQGSQFHFTIPVFNEGLGDNQATAEFNQPTKKPKSQKKHNTQRKN
ncbi:GAF sensor signal transduction histidine kinase [Stanieria cyanosphaera PCC 7437]|uniref:histidine kinase n=1 Tax=Stanieria cyanosphaera (strain ATCC 29371 / PCC 7437) TaxID=111780 RepID=K9XZ29_STAC7|nr:DICT sensory domain-containing protein [Stanieria cyanosphaera]AFZ37381.1 GAF sensor signal transduction histidine kinase [Stanieria cyanosphaera PCC 7437]